MPSNNEDFLSYPIDNLTYECLDEDAVAVGRYPENDAMTYYHSSAEENIDTDDNLFTPEASFTVPTEYPDHSTKKKKVIVDKAVVSLLPAKLQNRPSIKNKHC
jgi:hypothetical protein